MARYKIDVEKFAGGNFNIMKAKIAHEIMAPIKLRMAFNLMVNSMKNTR